MNRLLKNFFQRPSRRPIRNAHRLGAAFGPLEDRTLMSVTASLQSGVLNIRGSYASDTINVRYLNSVYSVDGVNQTFAGSQVQSIRIEGNGGNDRINLHTEGVQTIGNAGSNFVGPAGTATTANYSPIIVPTQIYAGDGNDIIDGGEGPDVVFGRGGMDTIRGWNGADYLDGGLGNDDIQGGAGLDVIFGDLGNDRIDGGADFDVIYGGPDANTIADSPLTNQIVSNEFIQGIVADPALRERVRYLQYDGALSRNDLLDVFSIVTGDATVSATEFADLQRIEGAASYLGMPDSVRVLTKKVINYDAANKQFAGGTLEPDGQLHAGDPATTFNLLVNKWFLGVDHPLAQNANRTYTFSYTRANGPLFRTDSHGSPVTPTFSDVVQGYQLDDGVFLSNLAGTTNFRSFIGSMITDNGDDTFTVRFYVNGQTDYVTVDRQLPSNLGYYAFAHAGRGIIGDAQPIWAGLIEKAYAQLNASGKIGRDGTNSYQGIAGGGSAATYLQLSNGYVTQHNFSDDLRYLKPALYAGHVVTLQSNNSSAILAHDHTYLIAGISGTTVTLYDTVNTGDQYAGEDFGKIVIAIDDLGANATTWFDGR